MLNNVSYDKISAIVNEITVKTIHQTSDYLVDNYGETVESISNNIIAAAHNNIDVLRENISTLSVNASKTISPLLSVEHLSKTISPLLSVEHLSEYFNRINTETIRAQILAYLLDIGSTFIRRCNQNLPLFIIVYVICLVVTVQLNEMRREFNNRMQEMSQFIDDNELEHMSMIDTYRHEFKKIMTAHSRRISNGMKKLRAEQTKASKRQELMLYERIRKHRHEELRESICMYLDLFNQYASGDKYNELFNISEDIIYLDPKTDGAVIKQYFGKYFSYNKSSMCQILYPLNLAVAPHVYNKHMKDIRDLADSMPANSVKELRKFRMEVEENYAENFDLPIVRGLNETQIEYEISIFQYLHQSLSQCYQTYNMYCKVGLN